MTDPLARIDTTKLDPEFLTKLQGFLGACSAHGIHLVATYGYRDEALQAKLYAAYLAGGPRAAPPGHSAHGFGMAVDFLALDANGAAIPSSDAPEYVEMEELAPRYGLATGRHYADGGHVELADWRKVYVGTLG